MKQCLRTLKLKKAQDEGTVPFFGPCEQVIGHNH